MNKIILLLILLFLTPTASAEWKKINNMTVYGTSDKPVVLRWNSSSQENQVLVWIPIGDNADTSATYDIYDGDNLKSSYIIDQSAHQNQWVHLGWYHSSVSRMIKVILRPSNNGFITYADAIKVTADYCIESLGIIIDDGDTDTSSTGTWIFCNNSSSYADDSRCSTNLTDSYQWIINNLPQSRTEFTYDYYIKNVETDTNYPISKVTECTVSIMMPRTGHWIPCIRASTFNSGELSAINAMSRDQLIERIQVRRYDVVIAPEMTEDDIRNAMIASGMKSTWTCSDSLTNSIVKDCIVGPWWIYTYPAPPGPIEW